MSQVTPVNSVNAWPGLSIFVFASAISSSACGCPSTSVAYKYVCTVPLVLKEYPVVGMVAKFLFWKSVVFIVSIVMEFDEACEDI